MSYGPFDIAPVIARLEDQLPKSKWEIAGAAEMAEVTADTRLRTSAVYCIPGRETPGDKIAAGSKALIQQVTAEFSVVMGAKNYRVSDKGTAQLPTIINLQRQVRTALMKWRPGECDTAVRFAGSRLVKYDKFTIWWEDRFETGYQIRVL